MDSREIKESRSMRDVLQRYGLQPSRKGFISCPFHGEDKHPSLKIYEKDFHCFSCGANGDIFEFVMRMEDVSFKEAFQILGGQYQGSSRKLAAIRQAEFRWSRARIKAESEEFTAWWENRCSQVCKLLRLLDVSLLQYPPLSAEWCVATEMKIQNEYKYWILTNGTRDEQEGMRKENE